MMQQIIQQISLGEALAVIFSIIQVILATRNNSKTYLFGIAGISLSLYVMFISKLYAEFILNLYYLIMSIYGWVYWSSKTNQTQNPISSIQGKEHLIVWGIVVGTFVLFWNFLTHFTDSDVALWDSLVSAFAWAGMWLMAKRKIENWILLNISNMICIPLMIHKDLYLYAGLSMFLFIMAIIGYFKWRTIMQSQNPRSSCC